MRTNTTLSLTETKQWVDLYLQSYSEQRIDDAKRIGPSYVRLREAINALVQVGGKRLRPYTLLATFQAYAPERSLEDILPAAAAQELIHLAMLIHDDIIDRDFIRYGIPNVAGYYQTFYKDIHVRDEDISHMALSAALLGGDALIADAHQTMRATRGGQELVRGAEDILSESIFAVIGGELLDTEVALLPKGEIDPLSVAEFKTSTYSFIGPLTTGALLAGAPHEEIVLLRALGKHIGIGFQLQDDLLGIFGDEAKTGKSTSTDITEGKRTYMIQQFEQLADANAQREFASLFQNPHATEQQIERVRTLLVESGAEESVRKEINHHVEQCERIIEQLAIQPAYKQSLQHLVALCMQRES